MCKSDEVCCPKNKVVQTPIEVGCGYSIPEETPTKTNAKADYAAYAEFPWMVALMTYVLV